MADLTDKTTLFSYDSLQEQAPVKDVLKQVCQALEEKGYNPVGQLVGYLLSGDPTYITSYKDARAKITGVDRDILLEHLVEQYLTGNKGSL